MLLYAWLGEERARPIYQGGCLSQGSLQARAAPKHRRLINGLYFKVSFCWLLLEASVVVLFPPNRGLGQNPNFHPERVLLSGHFKMLTHRP